MRVLDFIKQATALLILLLTLTNQSHTEENKPEQTATTFSEASTAMREKRWGAAAGFYQGYVDTNPQNYYAYFLLGSALHNDGQYQRALRANFIAARYSQVRGNASYNVVRSYSKLGEIEMALLWLERSLMNGFDNFKRLSNDPDTELLRLDRRYGQILNRSENFSRTKMPIGTSHHLSAYDKVAENISIRTLGAELPFGTGGVAVSQTGDIFVGDFGENLYQFDNEGNYKLFMGEIQGASGNAFDSQGNLYQSHFKGNKISKISPDGTSVDIITEGLRGPVGIAFAADDTMYIANCDGRYISKVTTNGEISVFAKSPLFFCPNSITLDPEGNLYAANFHDGVITKITPSGIVHFFRQMPEEDAGYILYLDQALYVTGFKSHYLSKLTMDGDLTLLAGNGTRGIRDGNGVAALLSNPNGLAASSNGNCLYTNDGIGDWRDSNSDTAFPWHSMLREIKLDPSKPC